MQNLRGGGGRCRRAQVAAAGRASCLVQLGSGACCAEARGRVQEGSARALGEASHGRYQAQHHACWPPVLGTRIANSRACAPAEDHHPARKSSKLLQRACNEPCRYQLQAAVFPLIYLLESTALLILASAEAPASAAHASLSTVTAT